MCLNFSSNNFLIFNTDGDHVDLEIKKCDFFPFLND